MHSLFLVAFLSLGLMAEPEGPLGLSPVVLVPGLSGSVIKAKLQDTHPAHWSCKTNSDWFTAWLSVEQLVPYQKDCLMHTLNLQYINGTYRGAAGVTLNASVDFGGVGGIAYLDPDALGTRQLPYYAQMIDMLIKDLGYKIGHDLHGAPYDWRLAADSHELPGAYFDQLKALIEQTMARNGGRRAHIVSHSLGGPTAAAFLLAQGDAWCSRFISSYIPIAGVWAGSAAMAQSLVSGFDFGIPFVPHDYVRPVQRNASSGIFLLPSIDAWADVPIVSDIRRNYSAADWPALFEDLGLDQTAAVYSALTNKSLIPATRQPPAVRMHVIYSSGIATPERIVYDGRFVPGFDRAPVHVVNGDGDDVVNVRSSEYARRWQDDSRVPSIDFHHLKNVSHIGLVSHAEVFRIIRSVLSSPVL